MKDNCRFIFVFVLLLLVIGCTEKEPVSFTYIPEYSGPDSSEKAVLALELEHHFDNDSIWLRLDELTILSDKITTDYTISAAWLSGPFDFASGEHTVSVYHVTDKVAGQFSFILQDTMTIRITYKSDKKEFGFYEESGLVWWRD